MILKEHIDFKLVKNHWTSICTINIEKEILLLDF